ncbi:hypothetical protein D3C81_1801090 [compost metagenome]
MTAGIGIEPRRRGCIHLPHLLGVARVGGGAIDFNAHITGLVIAGLQSLQHLFRRVAQGDTKVIDQAQFTGGIDLRVQRHFGVRGAAPYQ